MQISVKVNFNIENLNIEKVNQIGLFNSANAVKTQAQENAPYQTWKLRQSINIDPLVIKKGQTKVRIWPRKVVYAIVREFVNKKNPHRRFYMKRAFEKADTIAKKEFENAVKIVLKSISKK